jgi:hypothetical protein
MSSAEQISLTGIDRMEVPQWLKNIWSRPPRNNYAESLVPRGLLNNNAGKNTTRKNNGAQRLNASAPAFVPQSQRLNANAPSFVPQTQSVPQQTQLRANAPAYTPSTGGKRRQAKRQAKRQTKRQTKRRKHRKSRSKGQRR